MSNATFKTGDSLATASICNSDCIFEAKVIKRTKCTVTIEMYGRETKRCNVDRKSTRLNSSHITISYAVFC